MLCSVLDLGVIGVGYSIPIATFCGTMIAAGFYLSGVWKKNQIEVRKNSSCTGIRRYDIRRGNKAC